MSVDLAASQAACEQIVRQAGSSFELAMRLFPRQGRDGVYALYAFFRVTDDLADSDAEPDARAAAFAAWEDEVRGALAGQEPKALCLPAVLAAVGRHRLPQAILTDTLAACRSDLQAVRLADWAAVDAYCDGVAGTVGEACLRILNESAPEVLALSQLNARAVQLTNILRDVDEDWHHQRCYLPADLLARHDVTTAHLAASPRQQPLLEALDEAAQRAADHFRRAEPLFDAIAPASRPPIVAMTLRYRRLLDQLRRGALRQNGRARLGGAARLGVMGAVVASRWWPTWRG